MLAESLKRPKEARELLLALAERCDSSTPLVQLVQIDLEQNDLDAAADTINKIRSRWKEAATGDILEGQLSLKRGNIPAAREHFAEALKKDPDNKIVQFWKAQLDSRTGSVSEAARALEDLIRNRPSKEVDTGVTLMTAAQSALANLSLQTENFDDAIRRFEESGQQRHRELEPDGPVAADHGLCRPRPVATGQAGAGDDPQRHQESPERR